MSFSCQLVRAQRVPGFCVLQSYTMIPLPVTVNNAMEMAAILHNPAVRKTTPLPCSQLQVSVQCY